MSPGKWGVILGVAAVVGVIAVAFGQTRDRLSLRLVGLLLMLGVLGIGTMALVRYVPKQPPVTLQTLLPTEPAASPTPAISPTRSASSKPKRRKPKKHTAPVQQVQPPPTQQTKPHPVPSFGGQPSP